MRRGEVWQPEGTDFRTSLDGLSPADLHGFFVDWPNPPTADTLYRILQRSHCFVQAISDGVLSASIPLLEVRPAWQGVVSAGS